MSLQWIPKKQHTYEGTWINISTKPGIRALFWSAPGAEPVGWDQRVWVEYLTDNPVPVYRISWILPPG